MRAGLLLPTREAAVSGQCDRERLLGLATLAEEAGFDSVWAGESLLARPRMDPLVLLAGVAARTERLALGTAVLLPALRAPFPMAHSLASLDRLAKGRLIVGVGGGFPMAPTEAEFDAAGARFDQRIGRLLETVEIWRALWSSTEPVTFDGKYSKLDGVRLEPRPLRPGGPPLWLAGAAPAALRRTGRHFDGWLPYSPTVRDFADQLVAVRAAAAEAGRDAAQITPAMYVTVNLAEDRVAAERELERYCEAYYGLPLDGMRQMQAYFSGTPDECLTWLSEYAAAGARHFVFRFGTLGDPSPMAEMAGAEILPALRQPAVQAASGSTWGPHRLESTRGGMT